MASLAVGRNGFTVIEALIAVVIIGIAAVGFATLLTDQQKAMRGVSAKLEAEGIRKVVQEILGDSNSCAASVQDAYPTAPTSLAMPLELRNVIRRYRTPPPAGWTNSTHYSIGTTYGSLVKIESLRIRDFDSKIDATPGPKFDVLFSFTGSVLGVSQIRRTFDAFVSFRPSRSLPSYAFSCSTVPSGGSNGSTLDFTGYLPDGGEWRVLSLEGGRPPLGRMHNPPFYFYASNGQYPCGEFTTVIIDETYVPRDSKAVLVGFVNSDSIEPSPMLRVFTIPGQLVGTIGQSGRGGDGRAFGLGGELVIPLVENKFRIQSCRKDEIDTTYYYVVKAVIN